MAATNTRTKKVSRQEQASEEISTRELILSRSLELINERGMVDFRIDTLATSLGLSPGNITYHFSRKEDICVALWERYLEEYGQVHRSLTTLLDIKQLFIIARVNIRLNYKYRGVVIFRSADRGAMQRDIEAGRIDEERHQRTSERVVRYLTMNGYIEKGFAPTVIESIHPYHYILSRWSINFAYQDFEPEEVESQLDYLALLSLNAVYPILNQKGRDEFDEIMEKVKSNTLLENAKRS